MRPFRTEVVPGRIADKKHNLKAESLKGGECKMARGSPQKEYGDHIRIETPLE